MANSSKAKGYRGEVEVVELLQTILNEECDKACVTRIELQRSPAGRDIRGLPWIAIEVKRREQDGESNVLAWWNQTKANALPGQLPVLIWRRNFSPWKVRMFARLPVRFDAKDGPFIQAPVDIPFTTFAIWFRERVRVCHLRTTG
jgi:hypothetical protein